MSKIKTKRVLFITGTRADYGKIKSLMKRMDASPEYEVYVYVSGMHLLAKYGSTYKEVLKDKYQNVHVAFGQQYTQNMSYNMGNVLMSLSAYVEQVSPDMILVHGDRIDALAGAVTGALNNILVAHIEGGEISGTIDDSIRHAVSKFAHLHFVCNEEAKNRIIQLGEPQENIYVIGSPDIDVMMGEELPDIEEVKQYYDIEFDKYGIFMYHPVTTEVDELQEHMDEIVAALKASQKKFVVIYPNNDLGTDIILRKIGRELEGEENFRVFPSIRFEYFLTLLKKASVIIGNSSAGIRESGVYGIPAIDIGTRQQGRYSIRKLKNIQHVTENRDEILEAIENVGKYQVQCQSFGKGNSTELFLNVLGKQKIWNSDVQKKFIDL